MPACSPAARLVRMYAAQHAAATSTSTMPTGSSAAPPSPSSTTPVTATPDPQPLGSAPRQRGRQAERTEQLDRHGDAERDPVDGGVERQVHRRQDQPEGDDGPPVVPRAAQATAGSQQQHQRGAALPDEHHAGRADVVEQAPGDTRADLHRQHRPEQQPDGEAAATGAAGTGTVIGRHSTACASCDRWGNADASVVMFDDA